MTLAAVIVKLTVIIHAAVLTLKTFLGTQATTMISLRGEALDVTKFPEDHWPTSQAVTYNDATVPMATLTGSLDQKEAGSCSFENGPQHRRDTEE